MNIVEQSRTANLLAALSLALTDAIDAAADGPGPSDCAALVTVGAYPGTSIDALSRILGLTHSASSRLVDRLERQGLVLRQPAAEDARARCLALTAAGEEAAVRFLEARRQATDRALAALSPAQQEALTGMVEAMLGALTPDRRTCDHTCRLCEAGACPQERCPVEQAALRSGG